VKLLAALLLLIAPLAGTCDAQNCLSLKPIELPPLGHPNATQTCVCASMNKGCHWAWVDKSNSTAAQQSYNPPPYVNLSDQAAQEAFRAHLAAKQRERELREQQQFIEQQQRQADQQQRDAEERQDARVKVQNAQANDLEILKAVHDGVLAPVTPGEHTTLPTIKNSAGQEFRVVAPASDHPAPPDESTDTNQYFTQGLLNGRMWAEVMTEPERVFYVASFLQGYAIACLSVTDDTAQQKACYAKLGNPAYTNPVDPHEIVEGVDKIFASPVNRGLIIPIAIKAATMKASGEPQDGIDRFLQSERSAVAAPAK
jgi:hypothetical protein